MLRIERDLSQEGSRARMETVMKYFGLLAVDRLKRGKTAVCGSGLD